MLNKVSQGSGTAHGYETDIDSLGQATRTHTHSQTHTFSPLIFFSTVTGQASTNRSARGRKQPGSEGTVCVRACMCEMIRLTACRKPLSPRAIQDLQAAQNHLRQERERK